MSSRIYIQLLLRVLLLIANTWALFYVFGKGFSISVVVLALALCFQAFLLMDYIKQLFRDVEKSVDCLLHDDYSISIPRHKRSDPLYDKTALLIEKHKQKSKAQSSEQLIFTRIIESLAIGILILRKSGEGQTEVYQMNTAFTDFLKIPKYQHWELLEKKIQPLARLITDWKAQRHVVTLSVNGQKEEFFLKTSATQTSDYNYLIVSLETIQQLIDKKEKEAWYKLMNVMSHEIINTITPISSLAENLESLLQEEAPDADTLEELSQGLGIIKKRSHHLNSFVDTYRKLAELPMPKKERLDLSALVQNTLELFTKEFSSQGVRVEVTAEQAHYIQADKEQLEQVIINLISNSLYALEGMENPKIDITLSEANNRTLLTVTDNGSGISEEIKEHVFIPYFTTRKNGSGIGLTLAKSIVESHQGSMSFSSKPGETVFRVVFRG